LTESEFRRLAAEAAKSKAPALFLGAHAKQRMIERDITITQIKRVLVKGRITEGPYETPAGDWKGNFRATDAGQDIEVVVALKVMNGVRAFIVTVIDKHRSW
jgi:hypothetical protein